MNADKLKYKTDKSFDSQIDFLTKILELFGDNYLLLIDNDDLIK